jgi:hypothetical protein
MDAVRLTLEHVAALNQHSLRCLRSGHDLMALSVLKEALRSLSGTGLDNHDFLPPAPMGDDFLRNSLPLGLALFSLPSFQVGDRGQVPGTVVSIPDTATLFLHHDIHNVQRLLNVIVLYHTALAIHRGFCRVDGIGRLNAFRSSGFYDLCKSALALVSDMNAVELAVDASIGQLHALFDCSGAA